MNPSIYNQSAEEALIACAMMDPRQLDLLNVEPYHFRDLEHQKIWRAMLDLPSPDSVTVSDKSGVPISRINDILMGDVQPWNVDKYAKIVKDYHSLRQLLPIGQRIVTAAYEDGADVNEIIAVATNELDSLSTYEEKGVSVLEAGKEALESVEANILKKHRGEKVEVGYQTGIGYIDRNIRGLKKGWTVLIAGKPKSGKTYITQQIAKVFAMQAPGSYVSLEMRKQAMMYRLYSMIVGVDATEIEFGNVDSTAMTMALAQLEKIDMELFCPARLSVQELRTYVAKQKTERNIGWCVVDYISLLTSPSARSEVEQDRQLSAELTRIAKEFNVMMLMIESTNKLGADGIMKDSSISGSYGKVFDADLVLGLSMYPKKGNSACVEIEDFDRRRQCRVLKVLDDRHRGSTDMQFPLEMVDRLMVDLVEDDSKPYI